MFTFFRPKAQKHFFVGTDSHSYFVEDLPVVDRMFSYFKVFYEFKKNI